MSALPPPGAVMDLPDLPGRWSSWSPAAEGPGAFFAVPADDEARATGVKYAVIRAIQKATDARPTLTLIRTDPPQETLR